jgi:hypothetical protein
LENIKQRFGLLQVRRVKPFRKPIVHLGQQAIGLLVLVLALPEPGEASGGADFPRFGVLATGNGEGLVEADFCLGRIRNSLLEQQLPLQPM